MAISSVATFLESLREAHLLKPGQWDEVAGSLHGRFTEAPVLATDLVGRGWLTEYQSEQILQGKGHELTLGQYLLLDRLGRGGMGEVFKARHQRLDRLVALKVIRKDILDNPFAIRRFQREAQLAARLNHPNIVTVYDADQVGEQHFFTMELVEGIDLAKLIRTGGPIRVRQACDLIRQASLGLQHAHERDLVHRDIKPSNLFLASAGSVVKLLDLGLARLLETGDPANALTKTGVVMGTADYMAPEQALDASRADIRADIYSLGCTFYYLLTGRPPFPGGSFTEKLLQHQQGMPQSVEELRPDIEPVVAAILFKMMAKLPKDRYQTPAEVAIALDPLARLNGLGDSDPLVRLNGSAGSGSAGSDDRTTTKIPISTSCGDRQAAPHCAGGRRRVWWLGSIAVGVGLVAGILWLTLNGNDKIPSDPVPRRLVVTQTKGLNTPVFASLGEALAQAKPGDHIVVQQEEIEEQLVLAEGTNGHGVTIEGAAPSGKPVSWRAPLNAKRKSLVELTDVAGFCLKGFVLDGRQQVDDLVNLSGFCPGLRLENVHFLGFRHSAVRIRDCTGEKGRPVALVRLSATTTSEAPAALTFESNPRLFPGGTRHLQVTDSVFEGPYRAVVQVASPLAQVQFERNRFFKGVDGILYLGQEVAPHHVIDLDLSSNTFCDIKHAALYLKGVLLAEKTSRMVAHKNLFVRTGMVATADPCPVAPLANAQWIWFGEDGPDGPDSGKRYFRTRFLDSDAPVTKATLHVFCDSDFHVWLNGVPVAQRALPGRVHTFDVTTHMNGNSDTLYSVAVQCEHSAKRAGLLAQLVYETRSGSKNQRTDARWKAAKEAPDGWQKREFDARAWAAATGLEVTPLFAISATGNVRDRVSNQGNLPLQTKMLDLAFPGPDAAGRPRVGRAEMPIGAPPEN